MSRGSWLATIAAGAAAVAVAAPAAAKAGHAAHPSHPGHPGQPLASRRCAPHRVAYIASGQFVSWAATQSGTGRWTGTMTVHLTRSNHHARNTKGDDVTYTLSNTRVRFAHGSNPPAAGDPVKVLGKVSEVAKRCTHSGPALPVTVRKVDIRGAKSQTDQKANER